MPLDTRALIALATLSASSLFAQSEHRAPWNADRAAPPAGHPTIVYHGGPVLLGTPTVYIVYYGGVSASSQNILDTFFSNIGGSDYFAVNTTYYDKQGSISGLIDFNPQIDVYFDKYSQGKTLSGDAYIKSIAGAISSGALPADDNGVYFFINSPDVTIPNGWLCAFHGNSKNIASGHNLKYAIVPLLNATNNKSCSGNIVIYHESNSPNNNIAADTAVDSAMHELSETVTDPLGTAWYTRGGSEDGDLCNFNYGATFIAPNGTHADATLGGLNYLFQTIWENKNGGFCSNTLQ